MRKRKKIQTLRRIRTKGIARYVTVISGLMKITMANAKITNGGLKIEALTLAVIRILNILPKRTLSQNH